VIQEPDVSKMAGARGVLASRRSSTRLRQRDQPYAAAGSGIPRPIFQGFALETLGDAAVAPQLLPHRECVGSEAERLGIDFENPDTNAVILRGREPQSGYLSETTDNRL
jgi:hypothetical protein